MSAINPISVAVLAFPQSTASTIYGMYDIFKCVGRDWGVATRGEAGPELMRPLVVSAHGASFAISNGVRIAPDFQLSECDRPDVICIPEVSIVPGTPLAGCFDAEIDWLLDCYRAGSTIATACSGALVLAEAGLLKGQEATTHWAYCDVLARHRCTGAARAGRRRRGRATGDGRRRHIVAGSGDLSDRAFHQCR